MDKIKVFYKTGRAVPHGVSLPFGRFDAGRIYEITMTQYIELCKTAAPVVYIDSYDKEYKRADLREA